jgi:hypothetical protein
MLRNRLMTIFGLVLIAGMVLSACGTPTAAPATEPPAAPATEVPAPVEPTAVPPTAEPTKVPVTRKGGWLD